MKKLFIFTLLLLAGPVLAQTITGGGDPDQAFSDSMTQLVAMLGTNGSTAGIVLVVTQVLLRFMDTSYFNRLVPVQGREWKLPAVSILSLVSGMATMVYKDGMPLHLAIFNSTTLTGLMVFGHQWLKWSTKPKVISKTGAGESQ